jgi:RNA polymerase sigma-70 factor (ECF subfamily)
MLRPADQELLMLTGQYDLSLEEVAVALEISANAAGVRIHRARERLRAAFARTMEAGGEAA